MRILKGDRYKSPADGFTVTVKWVRKRLDGLGILKTLEGRS